MTDDTEFLSRYPLIINKPISELVNKQPRQDDDEDDTVQPKQTDVVSDNDQESDNGHFPSYTAMIAQAVLSMPAHKITLGGIYEFIDIQYKGLEKRVKGWRNCVRHNLSLNECFIKLGRSENGRGNDWTIHPNYLNSFLKGEFRKRRACMKKRFDFVWLSKEYATRLPPPPSHHCNCGPCTMRTTHKTDNTYQQRYHVTSPPRTPERHFRRSPEPYHNPAEKRPNYLSNLETRRHPYKLHPYKRF